MTRDPKPRDPITRGAARTATLVAIPVAVLVAVGSLLAFGQGPNPSASAPSSSAPAGPEPTGPVAMEAPTLAGEPFGICQSIVADLPDTVIGKARRPVTAGSEQNAAYGEPPITLACGTPLPAVAPTDDLIAVSGVCWLPQPRTGGTAYTTVDRTVPVTVLVPGPAEGSAQSVAAFSPAIGPNDPTLEKYPSGCQP